MHIIWAPTDVASQYVGTPQRERAIALTRYPLPHIVNFSCPFSVPSVRPDDDPFQQRPNARFLATYPSVQFQVYIDGDLASESPVMRLGQELWRFDVRIPERSRLINIVVTDAGSRSPLDLADWVDAGFVLK